MSILSTITNGRRPWKNSILGSDAYKFSMLAGGRPKETEVFYLSFRRGRRLYMPVDLRVVVEDLIPHVGSNIIFEENGYLNAKGFPVDRELLNAITHSDYEILYAVPKGEWVDPREPVLTIRGPQALVSWLEPLLIGRVMYQMQVATAAIECEEDEALWQDFEDSISRVTCEEQKTLTLKALDGAGITINPDIITVDEQGYYDAVKAQCQKLLDTGVTPNRFFEVGLRAATCMDQHLIALKACKDMGFCLTSNVYGAWLLDMVPIGTLGHEGIMRWGGDDKRAYEAHMAALPKVIFLLDTNDTLRVGIPAAIALMKDNPDRMDGVRPDSGNLEEQFGVFVEALKEADLQPRPWIFEDGLNEESVAYYEGVRERLEYPEEVTLYGLGGYFIDRPEFTPYKRGMISMVYKLSWTERFGAAMKFGNELESGDSGKQSLPGKPVTLVRTYESNTDPRILVGQEGHEPEGYAHFTMGDSRYRDDEVRSRPHIDSFTQILIDASIEARTNTIASYKK